jgi:hypothetical protein
MGFRSDAAKEFVHGTVEALNLYLGIEHISTGGYNARANAVVERFMQTLNSMLRTCDDKTYKDIKNFLPASAFAHNTTYNSFAVTASVPGPSRMPECPLGCNSALKRAGITRIYWTNGKPPLLVWF